MRNVPRTLTLIVASQSATGSSSAGASRTMPALLTRMSIRWWRSAIRATPARTDSGSVTSQPAAL
jgi:hypothetical protein